MMPPFDDFDFDLEGFDFDELVREHGQSSNFDSTSNETVTAGTGTQEQSFLPSETRPLHILISVGDSSPEKRKRHREKAVLRSLRTKRKAKTIVQLPEAVRSTQFAQFMLYERFKAKPENELQQCPELKLYTFPRFNRCNGLMYFPSTLVSFLNNFDLSSMSGLFHTFFHRDCSIRIEDTTLMGNPASPSRYIEFQKLMNEMHPDKFMCMHSTKEVGNQIRAELYFKLTEYKTIYESVARSRRHPHFQSLLVPSRSQHLKSKFDLTSLSEDKLTRLSDLLDSGADVELLGRIDLRLVFNRHSKLVHEMVMSVEFTDFHDVATTRGKHEVV